MREKTNASNNPVAEHITKRDEEFLANLAKVRHSEDRDPEIQYEFDEHVLMLAQPSDLAIY